MPLVLDSFRKAIAAPQAVQARSQDAALMNALDAVTRDAIQSGVIQHFEFTYELAWKFIKRRLEADIGRSSVDGVSRRELFRIAAENGLIEDVEAWFQYHVARNETSRAYDLAVAARVYTTSLTFAADAVRLLTVLEARNA
jgi:nucleotidyltransferase substrate binding protein (TIGR01987 family)